MTRPLVSVHDLVKHFPAGRGRTVKAVNQVSFTIARGEALGLVGESGSGKTTVGHCLLKLLAPTAGTILIDGSDVSGMTTRGFRPLRGRVQMVFQERALRLAQSAHANRNDRGGAAPGPAPRAGCAAPPAGPRSPRDGRLRRLGARQVPPPVERGRAAADRARPGARHPARARRPRRADVGPGRLRAGGDPRPAERSAREAGAFVPPDIARSDRGPAGLQPRRGHVSREDRRDLRDRADIRTPAPSYSRALLSSVLYPDPERSLPRFVLEGEIPSPIDPPAGCHLYQRCPWAKASCRESCPDLVELLPGRRVACFEASGRLHEAPAA